MSAADGSVRDELERRLTESLESRRAAAEQRQADNAARLEAEQREAEARAQAAVEERDWTREQARQLFGIFPDIADAARQRLNANGQPDPVPGMVLSRSEKVALPQLRRDRWLGKPVEYERKSFPIGGMWIVQFASARTGERQVSERSDMWASKEGSSGGPTPIPVYRWELAGILDDGAYGKILVDGPSTNLTAHNLPQGLTDKPVGPLTPEDYTTPFQYETLMQAVTDFCIRNELEEPLLGLGRQAG